MKKYNVKLHYQTHEKHKPLQLEGEERKVAFERLKKKSVSSKCLKKYLVRKMMTLKPPTE